MQFLERLLGLEQLGFDTPGVEFVLARPLPAWAWVMLAAGAIGLAWWSYRRLPGPRWARMLMGLSRGLVVALLAFLAAGPTLRLEQMRLEPDRILVAIDRSASLAVRDAPDGATRDSEATTALDLAAPALEQLSERSRISYTEFDTTVRDLTGLDTLSDADGNASSIGAALTHAIDQARGAPIGGIVLVTDGRSTDTIPPATMRRLIAERVPVFPIPLGSPEPVRSVSIARAETPTVAFVRDSTPVQARIEWTTAPPPGSSVQLVNRITNEVLDQATLPPNSPNNSGVWVNLAHTARQAGNLDLEIRLSGIGSDANPEDNTRRVAIGVIDRAIRILYVDGHPRWEHRYLKNLLLREPSIDSSILLLASGRQYAQEGDTLIGRLPLSPEEWDEFDVIIIGDVDAELFGTEQLASLREHVATRGAGVLWMTGPGATPSTWHESQAAPLLPVRPSAGPIWDSPVTMTATTEADRLGVLRTDETGRAWSERLSDASAGWTQLRWALRLEPKTLKPGVSVLADAVGTHSGDRAPAVVTMRFGAGRSTLVATDEIWRWRYGRGESLPERFWIPLMRMLARGRIAATQGVGTLTVDPVEPEPGMPTLIELRVFDQAAIDRLPQRVRARVIRADGREETIVLTGDGASRSGIWTPTSPGGARIELAGAGPDLIGLEARTVVTEPGDERRSLDADHDALLVLAQQTGGQIVPPTATARLAELIPNRSRAHAGAPTIETLWDRGTVLALLLVMLTLEWVGRRICRLA